MYIKKLARKENYNCLSKRNRKDIETIVFHYTANEKDTVKNNLEYFSREVVKASAHLFCDDNDLGKSVPLNRTAYSVGKDYRTHSGRKDEGQFFGIVTNSNSVSIEICDFCSYKLSEGKIKNIRKAIKHIKKYCPNIKRVCRHYDVNGKVCPAPLIQNKWWKQFLKDVGIDEKGNWIEGK